MYSFQDCHKANDNSQCMKCNNHYLMKYMRHMCNDMASILQCQHYLWNSILNHCNFLSTILPLLITINLNITLVMKLMMNYKMCNHRRFLDFCRLNMILGILNINFQDLQIYEFRKLILKHMKMVKYYQIKIRLYISNNLI